LASLSEITERLRGALEGEAGLSKTLKLDLRGDGVVFIDGARVSNDDRPADCTVSVSKDDLEALAKGALDPMEAMMRGRLRVSGDMAVAMQLQPVFARARG
jgi:putative sterol carrier protein